MIRQQTFWDFPTSETDKPKWLLPSGTEITHLYGNVWILNDESVFRRPVVMNARGEPADPYAAMLEPGELRAIANWMDREAGS